MAELTNVFEQKLSLIEKIGFSLWGSTSIVGLAYATRLMNDKFIEKLPTIIEKLSYHVGNYSHICVPYLLAGMIEGKKSRKYSNIILGLTTTYHTLGEIFHSPIAPNLPQILPGTPDPKDIPVALLCAVGMYLINKKRVLI